MEFHDLVLVYVPVPMTIHAKFHTPVRPHESDFSYCFKKHPLEDLLDFAAHVLSLTPMVS